ncbi:MAG: S9 family peptidase, partial [Deltaproteobacteria bacterium]|nr:S9 family peptidase [Deltaproteobacteria bacterium]
MKIEYPNTRQGSEFRRFHGIDVPDPYRWLEQTESPEVIKWAAAQHNLAGDFLSDQADVDDCLNFLERNHTSIPHAWHCTRGEREFYFAYRENRPEPLLCVYDRGRQEEQVVADVNNTDDRITAEFIHVSPSGRYVAYNLGPVGSPLVRLYVYDVESRKVLESDSLETVAPMVAWHPSEAGYYYNMSRRLFAEDPNRLDGVYWHCLGTPHETDIRIFDYHQGAGQLAFPALSEDNQHLLILTHHFSASKTGVMVKSINQVYPQASAQSDHSGFIPLFDDLKDYVRLIGSRGSTAFFHTCAGAPRGRIVAIDLNRPEREYWTDLVPEGELPIARPERFGGAGKAVIAGNNLLVTFVKDAHDLVKHYNLKEDLIRQLDLPGLFTVDAVQKSHTGVRISIQSFLIPRINFNYDLADRLEVIEKTIPAEPFMDPDMYQISQVFYPAQDGTSIPLYLMHKPGLERSGNNPTLLYAYGGFNQAINPEYTPEIGLWLSLGGVYAIANIRGGGEYGAEWHAQACRENRQTSFDDFYA